MEKTLPDHHSDLPSSTIRGRAILASLPDHPLSIEERQTEAIELAATLLETALHLQTAEEKRLRIELANMMQDAHGKAFTTSMTDICFRSHRYSRVADQLIYLLRLFGIPRFLSFGKQLGFIFFRVLGKVVPWLAVPAAITALRRASSSVIVPGEHRLFSKHAKKRKAEGVRLNINHLGEAILGEEEAKRRFDIYIQDLLNHDDIEYISIKISTIYSQIHLIGWDNTLHHLKERLRELYRAAAGPTSSRSSGQKFINLDMEEYRDLSLTTALFKALLDEEEFLHFSAGIVLQAYLPEAQSIQKELTTWAIERVKRGGAPIKIRIVKGANLAMEQVEASLRGWAQAPYTTKLEVDANYKCMIAYGSLPEHARAVHIGIGSHNLFDIAYALILRAENQVEKFITFEMLEGMADHMRKAVQLLSGDILLYCPLALKKDFQNVIAYLIRRLDENTGPDNFLRHSFGLLPGTREWELQAALFKRSCNKMQTLSTASRRVQDRSKSPQHLAFDAPFENEPDTDFALPNNRIWATKIYRNWSTKYYDIPLVIGGKEYMNVQQQGEGEDPSRPGHRLYSYALADWEQVDHALNSAKLAAEHWSKVDTDTRSLLLASCAKKLRERRDELLGVMIADGGKVLLEGDPEISEAIDFAEYYWRSLTKIHLYTDIEWRPKGTILVTPPWNFPISIPAGGILAALAGGNTVIFKPAPEAVLAGWILVQALWDAGIPKDVLQFINCPEEPVGSRLISDPRLDAIILTGATSTAKLFKKFNPGLDLSAETGGKNSMIITGAADRDLAIRDLVQSAFGHAGQKCSATSIAILDAEVYDDQHFLESLRDAVGSLQVGSTWDLATRLPPLIRPARDPLLKALTTLEPGESWLVKPNQLGPNLWSPGVKMGVKEGSAMHQTELFGPLLAVMRASNLSHAISIANSTPYGLTAGLHSLDEREQKIWIEQIVAGNCYINRTTTGAIVRRQPFGGCKASSFGPGAKAGGPNYVAQFCHAKQIGIPQEKEAIPKTLDPLISFARQLDFPEEDQKLWKMSLESYSYWANYFEKDADPSQILGQDNIFRYRPVSEIALQITRTDRPIDILRTCAAALLLHCPLVISYTKESPLTSHVKRWQKVLTELIWIEEPESAFFQRISSGDYKKIRTLSPPSEALIQVAALHATALLTGPVLANGRFEMLHFLREISLSIDYHRYGNLGLREKERRTPVL
jgi:RHH-type proline utilization regulon transcriptional repressor/proline dehydrogenase/delta 1-pyrroline-5-carboxylate dehydrogenase